MLGLIKNFIREEDGMGTVEVVIIVAVLVAIALIFRKAIYNFVKEIVGKYSMTVSRMRLRKDYRRKQIKLLLGHMKNMP